MATPSETVNQLEQLMTAFSVSNDLDALKKLDKNAKVEFKKVPLKQLEMQLFQNLNQEAIKKVVEEQRAKTKKARP